MTTGSFRKFAVAGLLFNLLVIVWGAYVRASGSGAGCGSHWPLCNGDIIPQSPQLHTIIEFIHRMSSGLSLLFSVALYAWSRRVFPKGHLARKASAATLILTLSEALVGAGLVLFSLVDHDQSAARAFSISLHLVNTILLLASVTLAYRWSKAPLSQRLLFPKKEGPWLITALLAVALLGVTGALTALGDTLFKSDSLASGMALDFAPGSHFLLKLRVLHPILAVGTASFLFLLPEIFTRIKSTLAPETLQLTQRLRGLVLAQLAMGALNLAFLAPAGLQLIHLLLADCVWICLVLLAASTAEVSA